MIAADVDGREVLTIEGLGTPQALDPIQQAFVEHGALQCGFCTPGMVLAVKGLLALNASPTEDEIRNFLRGNLCRCTGYVKIIEAVVDIAQRKHLG
jgi:carbon-monoxide dehydrogenase small subunit